MFFLEYWLPEIFFTKQRLTVLETRMDKLMKKFKIKEETKQGYVSKKLSTTERVGILENRMNILMRKLKIEDEIISQEEKEAENRERAEWLAATH